MSRPMSSSYSGVIFHGRQETAACPRGGVPRVVDVHRPQGSGGSRHHWCRHAVGPGDPVVPRPHQLRQRPVGTLMLAGPDIRRHLLREEGEVIVDEVRHHWIVYVLPALEAALGVALVLWT